MPAPPLNEVLQYLLRSFQHHAVAALTDGQLLQQFVCHRDEAAFTALVQRHAGMVLTVAQRILRNFHAAEDVFQATFFVLAKKAGSIRRRQALVGWLYQTALRLALKAKAAQARRQAQERQSAAMPQAETDNGLDHAELCTVLTEELNYLPEKYRTPLVLHYLEGKSTGETAGLLGWSVGTTSGRLARARKLLHRRLVRRGFTLSSAVFATLLAENAALAAVSPLLLKTTVQGALGFAQGVAGGPAISAAAERLAQSLLQNTLLARLNVSLLALLTVSVAGAGLGTVSYGRVARNINESNRPDQHAALVAPAPPAENEIARRTSDEPVPAENAAPIRLSASGKVVDDNGRPVTNATVYLRERAIQRHTEELQKKDYTDILAQTTTDAAGKFSFENVPAERMKVSPSNLYQHPWNIVVTAKGLGLAWHVFHSRSEQQLLLTLGPEARVSGRLLDNNGLPVAGVRVQCDGINDQFDPDPRKLRHTGFELELWWSHLPLGATTDADGWFTVSGLPRGRHIALRAVDPRFARKYLSCATIANNEIDRINAAASAPASRKLLVDRFTARLEPSGTVRGQVLYGDTREPAVGARVNMGVYGTLTDQDGRYALTGFDTREMQLGVRPPEGVDYLATITNFAIPANTRVLERNFSLERGSVITGELREKDTGQPIRIPYVHISYTADQPKGAHASASTKPNGSYRIIVPQGNGKLWTGSLPGYVPADSLEHFRERPASIAIDVKPGATLTGRHFFYRRGMVLQGRVIDPEGKPVEGAIFLGMSEQTRSGADGAFTLRGLDMDYRNHFVVTQPARGLGAKVAIEPQKDSKPAVMELRLQPTQSATVRVIDENQQPVANASVHLSVNIRSQETATGYSVRPIRSFGPVSTNRDGKAAFPLLVVEGSYTVEASAPGYAMVQKFFRVEAAQQLAIPDLILLADRLSLTGVVVDPGGKPVEEAQVTIIARDSSVAHTTSGHDVLRTKADGRFDFRSLPKGEYRLITNLWKDTGVIGKDGRPAHKREAHAELRVQAGQQDIRVILHVPPDPNRAASLTGKPAPGFTVSKWLNRKGRDNASFDVRDYAGQPVLLAFLDGNRPSTRLLKSLNELHDRHGAGGLTIIRVYETPANEQELTQLSPTAVALVPPGLAKGTYSGAAQQYGVQASPAVFLIDPQGIVRHADVDSEALPKQIEALLKR